MARTRRSRVRVSGRFYITLLVLAILIGVVALILPSRAAAPLRAKQWRRY